jgi:hypothetical protein
MIFLNHISSGNVGITQAHILQEFIDGLSLQHIKLASKLAKKGGRILFINDTFVIGTEPDGTESPFNEEIRKNNDLFNLTIDENIMNRWFSSYPSIAGSNTPVIVKNIKNELKSITTYYWWWFNSMSSKFDNLPRFVQTLSMEHLSGCSYSSL